MFRFLKSHAEAKGMAQVGDDQESRIGFFSTKIASMQTSAQDKNAAFSRTHIELHKQRIAEAKVVFRSFFFTDCAANRERRNVSSISSRIA